MTIREIRLRPPVTIRPFASTDDCIRQLWTRGVRHLMVVDEHGLAGMVTHGALLESVGMLTSAERRLVTPENADEVLVADVMDAEAPCVHPDMLATDAAHRMLYEQHSGLPVVEDRRLLGIVTQSDLLQLFAGICWLGEVPLQQERVFLFGSRIFRTLSPRDTLREACRRLTGSHLDTLPVVNGDQVVGTLSDRDIRQAMGRGGVGGWFDLPVADVMVQDFPMLSPDNPLALAAELMRVQKVTMLPILHRGRLVSLLTVADLLGAFCTGATIHA